MKLRFRLDQADCFRRGVDAPKSVVQIEVDPASIPGPIRDLIADRMVGIDICQLIPISTTENAQMRPDTLPDGSSGHVVAKDASLDGLIEAVKRDQAALLAKAR